MQPNKLNIAVNSSEIKNNYGERREKLPAEVYYIESPTDDTVTIGLDVELVDNKFGRSVRWFDTRKSRCIYVSGATAGNDGELVFHREEKDGDGNKFYVGDYSFRPMTLDIYEQKAKGKLLSPPDFNSEEEMLAEFKSFLEE
jgi:hypothetical protein